MPPLADAAAPRRPSAETAMADQLVRGAVLVIQFAPELNEL